MFFFFFKRWICKAKRAIKWLLHVSMLTIVVICGHLKPRYLYMLCYLLSKNVPHKASMKLTNESYLAQYLSERKNIFQIEKKLWSHTPLVKLWIYEKMTNLTFFLCWEMAFWTFWTACFLTILQSIKENKLMFRVN